jgi:hypothetical protein
MAEQIIKSTGGLSQASLYELLRKQVEHEDNLINHRLNWLLLSQGFLFVAYGTILTSDNLNLAQKVWPLRILITVAVVVSTLTCSSIWAAFRAVHELRACWLRFNEAESKMERGKLETDFPPIIWDGCTRSSRFARGEYAAVGIPICIILAWISLGIVLHL